MLSVAVFEDTRERRLRSESSERARVRMHAHARSDGLPDNASLLTSDSCHKFE